MTVLIVVLPRPPRNTQIYFQGLKRVLTIKQIAKKAGVGTWEVYGAVAKEKKISPASLAASLDCAKTAILNELDRGNLPVPIVLEKSGYFWCAGQFTAGPPKIAPQGRPKKITSV